MNALKNKGREEESEPVENALPQGKCTPSNVQTLSINIEVIQEGV